MAEKQPDTFYSMKTMHKVFFLSSLLFVFSLLWMLWQDYAREWKDYQAEFTRIDLERTEADKLQAEKDVDQDKLEQLREDLAKAEKSHKELGKVLSGGTGDGATAKKPGTERLDGAALGELRQRVDEALTVLPRKNKTLAKLQVQSDNLSRDYYRDNQIYQFAKAELDTAVYEFEETQHKFNEGKADLEEFLAARDRLERLRKDMQDKFEAVEPITDEQRRVEAKREKIIGGVKELGKSIDELRSQVAFLEAKIARIQPGFVNTFRNLPFFDFIDPSIRVRQHVLPDYWDDYNFARVFKVDRCASCHMGIEKKGWGPLDPPFQRPPEVRLEPKPEGMELGGAPGAVRTQLLNATGIKKPGKGCLLFSSDSFEPEPANALYAGWKAEPRNLPRRGSQLETGFANAGELKSVVSDGAFFRWAFDGTFRCVVVWGGEELASEPLKAPEAGKRHNFEIVYGFQEVHFLVDTGLPNALDLRLKNPGADCVPPRRPRFVWRARLSNNQDTETAAQCALGGVAVGVKVPPPKVFQSHPRLELFLSGTSPHPIEKFGCTACHDGQGRALTFYDAGHTPAGEAQGHEWHEKYGWHELHHWDFPMKPLPHMESTCYKCHGQDEVIQGADQWNRGKQLFERAGCFGCHQTDGFMHNRKIGPDLYHLADKVTEEWTYRWILDPAAFRPTTRMPKIFGLSNTSSPDDVKRGRVAADAITTYLFSLSEPLPLREPEGAGDPAKGKAIFDRVGCRACHILGDRLDPGNWNNSFGPNLTGIGSKTNRKWLFNWVKDPKSMFPGTHMPDLRLSDDEANHLSAYLMTSTVEPEKDAPSRPQPEMGSFLDELTLSFLVKMKPSSASALRELAGMDTKAKKLLVGERFLNRQGCFGCHGIKGTEKLTPIGVTFTGGGAIGSKDIDRIDFGFVEVPHTRHDWLVKKVHEPRVFDDGRDRTYDDKLRMPYFAWLNQTRITRLQPADLRDLAGFARKLRKDSPVSKYLLERFSPELGKRLQEVAEKKGAVEPLEGPLLEALNRVLTGECIYREERFAGISLAAETLKLLKEDLPRSSAMRLNRTLLARAYPEHVLELGQIDATLVRDLATFVLGFVKAEVPPLYLHKTNEGQAALEAGRRILKTNNCQACHNVDGAGADTIRDAVTSYLSEEKYSKPYGMLGPAEQNQMRQRGLAFSPPPLGFVGERIQPAWLFKFLKKPFTVRQHLQVRMPTFGFSDDEAGALAKFFAVASNQKFPYESGDGGEYAATWKNPDGTVGSLKGEEYLKVARQTFKELECAKCHMEPKPGKDLSDLAPSFLLSKDRLKPEWVFKWIRDPQAIIPGTKMPQFWPDNTFDDRLGADAELQIKAVRDWVMQIKSPEDLK
ncbi:MAG: c-type cytochrome [Planctomycetes bacterium]|nr:c-type cytochrome [Planctomycetota bacterium]